MYTNLITSLTKTKRKKRTSEPFQIQIIFNSTTVSPAALFTFENGAVEYLTPQKRFKESVMRKFLNLHLLTSKF